MVHVMGWVVHFLGQGGLVKMVRWCVERDAQDESCRILHDYIIELLKW